jgi:TolB protein
LYRPFAVAGLTVAVGASFSPAPSALRATRFTAVPNVQKVPTNDEPFPSPDGRYLAIESNRTGEQQIYVISATTGRLVRRLTRDNGVDDTPSWSPDGQLVAYISTRNGNTGIYVVGADGSHERRLAQGLDYLHPTWSPEGRWIMYNVNSKAQPTVYELWAMRRDGSGVYQITHNAVSETTYGSWSPDGRHIVFRRKFPPYRSQVYVADADASEQRNLSNTDTYDGWPSWSPDGRWIVFASNRLESERRSLSEEIFVMRADGSDVRLLARTGGRNTEPRFSSNGRTIFFSHCTHKGCEVYSAPSGITGE